MSTIIERRHRSTGNIGWLVLCLCGSLGFGGELLGAEAGPRVLAPGIMTVIQPDKDEGDTYSGPRPFVEILQGIQGADWQPNYSPQNETLAERAKQVVYRRSVWYLEFSFKPVRMTYVDFPGPDGRIERKLVWYLVYKVRNPGFHLGSAAKPDPWGHELPEIESVDHNVYFFPQFVLRCFDREESYIDRVLPRAVEKIQAIEDPGAGIRLHNSVQISQVSIPVSTAEEDHSVWGVATWKDVDPQTDFFAVFVQRLTNAYRWEDPEGAFQAGDPPGRGRVYTYKTLQLNFWRPGDGLRQHEREIRLGMPAFDDVRGRRVTREQDLLGLYGVAKPLVYQWVYRP